MKIFGVKIFGVIIFWVKIFKVKILWVKYFWVKFFCPPPPSRGRGRGEGGEVGDEGEGVTGHSGQKRGGRHYYLVTLKFKVLLTLICPQN